MSGSRLPPKPGETPTKVVFDGVEPGSAEAQLLFQQHKGPIGQFHSKARQQRELSEQPIAHMQQAMPDGGRMRYSYNNGQETIHVALEPRPGTPVGTQPQVLELPPTQPSLAIDVLFDCEPYLAGDIWAYTETTVHDPGQDGSPGAYVETYQADFGSGWVQGPFTPEQIMGSLYSKIDTAIGTADLTMDYTIQLTNTLSYLDNHVTTATHSPASIIQKVFKFTLIDDGFHDWGYRDAPGYGTDHQQGYVTLSVLNYQGGSPAIPPHDTIVRHTTHEQRLLFDQLEYAQVTAVPEGRVTPASALKVAKTIERELVLPDDAPPGFMGHGFVAQPRRPVVVGQVPDETLLNVYVASFNNGKRNYNPGAIGATFEADDPSFEYYLRQLAKGRIRVREFVDQSPAAVAVHLKANMEVQHLEPAGPPTYRPESPDRSVTWHFAAAPDWQDTGHEPANPDAKNPAGASAMGQLLAQVEIAQLTVGTGLEDRTIHTTIGDQPVSLVLIAQVHWKPSERPHTHGTATIVPA